MSLMRQHQKQALKTAVKTAASHQVSDLRKAEYKKWLQKMRSDQNAVKSLTDHGDRNKKAGEILNGYLGYLNDWLESGANHQNDVLTQCVVWATDAERWDVLFNLADPAIANPKVGNLHWMKRPLVDFVCDGILRFADTEQKAGKDIKAPVWLVLERIQDEAFTGYADYNHVGKARCHKFCGLLAFADKDWGRAVALLATADEMYPNIGVKGKLEAAQKELDATTEIDATVENDSSLDQRPPAEQPKA